MDKTSNSLRWRFTASTSILLVAALSLFWLASYRAVEDSLAASAEARLLNVSDRLASFLQQGSERQIAVLDSIGQLNEVRAFLAEPGAETAAQLRELLNSLVRSVPARIGLALQTTDGITVMTGDASTAGFDSYGPGVSPFELRDGRVVYSGSVSLRHADARDGSLRELRSLGGDIAAGDALRALIGRDAQFLIGNRAGNVWTDLSRPVDGFFPTGPEGVLTAQSASGTEMLGLLTSVDTAPWRLWVALPTAVVMEPLASFSRQIGLAVLLLGFFGSGIAWLLGRGMTRPLSVVTLAAEAIREGDYSRRIRSDRMDEVGRLAQAFDAMAEEVESGRSRLEERVAERTNELEHALSELRAAQEELLRKERLAVLGELAGGVSHELRNPLATMKTALFILDSRLGERSPEIRRQLEILGEQMRVSEKIVGDLLERGHQRQPEVRSVSLAEIVEQEIRRLDAEASVRIRLEIPAGLPSAYADPDQVAQVIRNLVTNALQAMNGMRGTLTIRGSADNGTVSIAVLDEGPGIPPAELEAVFRPLYTKKEDGVGLGLSLSRALVETNGGTLVARASDQGASFLLTLPTTGD